MLSIVATCIIPVLWEAGGRRIESSRSKVILGDLATECLKKKKKVSGRHSVQCPMLRSVCVGGVPLYVVLLAWSKWLRVGSPRRKLSELSIELMVRGLHFMFKKKGWMMNMKGIEQEWFHSSQTLEGCCFSRARKEVKSVQSHSMDHGQPNHGQGVASWKKDVWGMVSASLLPQSPSLDCIQMYSIMNHQSCPIALQWDAMPQNGKECLQLA